MKIIKGMLLALGLLAATLLVVGYLYLYVLPTGPERTAAIPFPVGKHNFVIDAYSTTDRKTIRVWTYKPQQWTPDQPVLFVMHGMARNAESYLDAWTELAEQQGLLLVAPQFDSKFYRVITNDYQEGNLYSYFGWQNPESEWAFTVIENIFDHLNQVNGWSVPGYHMFGHSAGGQFVQRMVMLTPKARIRTAIAANAGTYTFADASTAYPFGLVGVQADIPAAFRKQLILLLGELDNTANQGQLDQSAQAMQQGEHRLARGNNFYQSASALASKQGLALNWQLQTVPGVGHDFKAMSVAAAKLL